MSPRKVWVFAPDSGGIKIPDSVKYDIDYRRRFFDNTDNMTRLFVHSTSLGVRAVQLIGYQPLV